MACFFRKQIAADSAPQINILSCWTLHKNCSPICKDDPGFLNRLVSLWEAFDILVCRSSFASFFTKQIAADSAPQIDFSFGLTLHQSCTPVCVDDSLCLNRLISLPEARDIPV